MEQGQAHRPEISAEAERDLGDPDSVAASNVERENWRYSTWRSTASYAVAIWSAFAFTM
jgi:hypothetical protein